MTFARSIDPIARLIPRPLLLAAQPKGAGQEKGSRNADRSGTAEAMFQRVQVALARDEQPSTLLSGAVLRRCGRKRQRDISPWVDNTCNATW
jgi:hypothetical protein